MAEIFCFVWPKCAVSPEWTGHLMRLSSFSTLVVKGYQTRLVRLARMLYRISLCLKDLSMSALRYGPLDICCVEENARLSLMHILEIPQFTTCLLVLREPGSPSEIHRRLKHALTIWLALGQSTVTIYNVSSQSAAPVTITENDVRSRKWGVPTPIIPPTHI